MTAEELYRAEPERCEAAHQAGAVWRGGPDGLYYAGILAAADAHDAEHGTYRVSEDLLRAYDELYEHMQWVVLPEETRILELIAIVGAASRPWRA